ncbi:mycothiol synthase [Thermasporomyces composti]|uniref:Mycothiol acetyltransferase n=1 Tax=Thermasporomyces composti TaxID=696763 RepID=A0A3D9V344_THECX|nr:mycothiol synthase [Thermasporomyces composti]REF36138.1 mycothiol synthase [Thermasporomyces composti]
MDRPAIRVAERLSPEERAAVERLNQAAARADGVPALDEAATLRLRSQGTSTHLLTDHLAAETGAHLTGYARIDPADDGTRPADATADVVVHPDARGRGLGRALVEEVLSRANGAPVRVWAHGSHPAAARLATATGFSPIRELWLMSHTAGDPDVDIRTPGGVSIRTFRPDQDEDAWLEANRAAFEHHPEQGRWTRADLDARMAERWFDPDGFFVAIRDGRLVGFHWTKVHDEPVRGIGPPPVGEIYVLGVVPEAQGLGLAKALAVTGLRHLRDRGVRNVVLFVEASNPAAIGLYTKLGFRHVGTDVMYRHPGHR